MTTRAGDAGPTDLTEAFGAARELLDGAEREATRHRSEADRYARQRELEAELLVRKARRLLHAAEEKAAVILATARAERADQVIDLDALEATMRSDRDIADHRADGIPPRVDGMLALAIAHALSDAFPDSDPT